MFDDSDASSSSTDTNVDQSYSESDDYSPAMRKSKVLKKKILRRGTKRAATPEQRQQFHSQEQNKTVSFAAEEDTKSSNEQSVDVSPPTKKQKAIPNLSTYPPFIPSETMKCLYHSLCCKPIFAKSEFLPIDCSTREPCILQIQTQEP